MKIVLLICMLGLVSQCLANTNQFDIPIETFLSQSDPAIALEIKLASPEKRLKIIQELRRIAACDTCGRQVDAKALLFRYGDPITISNVFSQFRNPQTQDSAADLISGQGSLEMLPLLAAEMFFEDPPPPVVLTRKNPRSFEACRMFYGFLSNTNFTVDVRHWIIEVGYQSPAKFREEMRRWWKENQAMFAKHDYRAVRPPIGWKPFYNAVGERPPTNATEKMTPSN